jgi:hypothetical protein
MPANPAKGTAQLGAELDTTLLEEFRAFCRERKESVRTHLEIAIRRHLNNPPPPLRLEVPPLPPVSPPHPSPVAPPIAGAEVEPERSPAPTGKGRGAGRKGGEGKGPGKK